MEDVLHVAVRDGQETFHPVDAGTGPEFALLSIDDGAEELVRTLLRHFSLHSVREGADARVVIVLLSLGEDLAVDLDGAVHTEHVQVEQLL